jgi:hypothetical protein
LVEKSMAPKKVIAKPAQVIVLCFFAVSIQ